jgi:hypothetical protein
MTGLFYLFYITMKSEFKLPDGFRTGKENPAAVPVFLTAGYILNTLFSG